jgi:hypothetical protein
MMSRATAGEAQDAVRSRTQATVKDQILQQRTLVTHTGHELAREDMSELARRTVE